MSYFDTINIRCPECGTKIPFKSYCGDCNFDEHEEDDVPFVVAMSLHGETEVCPKCGITVKAVAPIQVSHVSMVGKRVYDD